MRTCIATVSLGGTLEEKLAGIAAAGFGGIELLDEDLRRSGMSPRECALRCADLGLAIDLYQPFRRAEGVSREEFRAEVLPRFRRELAVTRGLGIGAILVVSNTDADAVGSRDVSVAQLAALGDEAAEHGVTVMFEALAWGTHIRRTADVWDALQQADHPALSPVVDTFHLYAVGEDAGVLDGIPGAAVGFAQLADAPWMVTDDLKTWSRNHRCFPGEGEFDLLTPVAALLRTGYEGPLSLEIFNPGYRERDPAEVARDGAESLRRLADRLSDAGLGAAR